MDQSFTPERRGPGRPPRIQTEPAIARSEGREDRKEETKTARRRRQGMGLDRNKRLYLPDTAKDPNFYYRWMNDTPGRIVGVTQQDDYDIVTEEMLRGEKATEGEGTPVKRAVGTGANGQWMYAYLCRKPKEFFDADKAEEQASIADAEKAMKEGPAPSADGLNRADHAYVPKGHKNIIG